MLEKGKINSGEFQIIVIAFTLGTAVLNIPALLATIAKQDAWIASALSAFMGLFFIFLYNQLVTLYPSMTFVEMNEKVFGKWVGKVLALLYLFFVYHVATGSVKQIGDFFTTQILVETPIEVIISMSLITCLIGVRLGLEVICRTAVIFFPWIVFLLFILVLFLIPEIEIKNIQPIFGEGIKPIIKGSFYHIGIPYLQLTILLMITPFVIEKVKMKKAFYSGTFIAGITLTILVLLSILVLGPYLTAIQTYPSYILGKKISIGEFLQRIEVIVAIIWVLTIYFKVTICYYGIALGLAQILGLKSYKILLFPIGILIITSSIFFHPNTVHLSNYIASAYAPFSLTICLFIPLLLLMVGKIRKNRSTAKSA